jgi:methylated-DNA-[protein]-cysteine S-methyltransferase
MVHYALLRTALDPLLAMKGPSGLVWLEFLPDACAYHTQAHAVARPLLPELTEIRETPAEFEELRDQLALYFTGQLETFDLKIDPRGTDFQLAVWRQLMKIPYGKLRTYGEIALTLGNPKATRAVGQAAGHNPLPILVPCHRVVGKSGALVGFAAGITTKARLLRLEGHTLDSSSHIEEPRLF